MLRARRMAPDDRLERRLAGALLVSLALHALVLSLHFGVPGLGTSAGGAAPVTVRLGVPSAVPVPAPPALSAPLPSALQDLPIPPAAIAPVAPGMRLVDPRPIPAPPQQPALPVRRARKARRIGSPVPHDMERVAPRVIAQDALDKDFVVATPQAQEAEQKTLDPKEAQAGSDTGLDAENAAAEAAEAARLAREREQQLAQEQARKEQLAEELARMERDMAARQNAAVEQAAREQAASERSAQRKAEQERAVRERLALQKAEQEKAARDIQALKRERELEQEKAAQERAVQEKLDREKLEQQGLAAERAAQERVALKRAAQEKAAQERAAQEKAAQERAAQDGAAQQRADDLAREKALAQAGAASGLGPGPSGAGAGAGSPGASQPGPLAGKSVRDLVKGLDLLKGSPPGPMPQQNRRAVVGRNEHDVPLRMFVDSWRQKIERNGTINYPPSWANIVRIDPLVNVALRSDGSVEEVTIIRSSGRADMDEAVRRIVRVNARYSSFPPNVASRYDVIDIRRVWKFDEALKLVEELP